MAQFSRLETLNAMYEGGLVPVFYNGDIEVAKQIVDAIAAGGGRVAEFTNRGDFAIEGFAELVKYARDTHPNMIMGVGSVIDAPTAAMYIANGANFVVGPTLNAEAAETCNRRKIPYSPGCGSATEIQQAHELGVEIVKLFPGGEVGGPAFVKAVKGPMQRKRASRHGSRLVRWHSASEANWSARTSSPPETLTPSAPR